MVMIPAATYGGKRCTAPGCGAFPRGKQFHCGDCHQTFAAKSQAVNHEDFHYLILKDRCPTAAEMIKAGLWTKTTALDTEVWHGRISRIYMQLAIADLSAFDDHEPLVTKTGLVLTEAEVQQLADEAERGYDVGDLEQAESRRVTPATIKEVVEKKFKREGYQMVPAVRFEGAFDFGRHGFHRYADGTTWILDEDDLKIKVSSWMSCARRYGEANHFKTEVRSFVGDLDGKTKVALRYTDLLDKDFKR